MTNSTAYLLLLLLVPNLLDETKHPLPDFHYQPDR